MFDELYKEAYDKLKSEIYSLASKLLITVNEEPNLYHTGELHAVNEVLIITNAIDDTLYSALNRVVEKEAAYYELQLAADESCSKQL